MTSRPIIRRPVIWNLLVGAAFGISLAGAACGGDCPPIPHVDVFPLDLQHDASASSDAAPDAANRDGSASLDAAPDGANPDASLLPPAAPDAGPPDAGVAPDGGAPPPRLNCASLAEGCTPGQSCPPACDCVLARERTGMDPKTIIDQCILFAGAGPPSVEIRSRLVVDCE